MPLPVLWRFSCRGLHGILLKGLNCNYSTKIQDLQEKNKIDATGSSTCSNKERNSLDQFKQDVKPFHKIPGPISLPVIGTLYLYLFGMDYFPLLMGSPFIGF